jgi:hypothetical protein
VTTVSLKRERLIRPVVYALLGVAVFLLPILCRAFYESYAATVRARAALEQGEFRGGVTAYAEAGRWGFPGNSYAEEAQRELLRLLADEARSLEERVRGYDLLVSAIHSSRHPLSFLDTARAERLAEARGKVAMLRGSNPYQIEPAVSPHTHPLLQLLANVLFWGWVGLGAWLCLRGFDRSARPHWRRLRRGGLLFLCLYGVWLLSLRFA